MYTRHIEYTRYIEYTRIDSTMLVNLDIIDEGPLVGPSRLEVILRSNSRLLEYTLLDVPNEVT